jgi:hypothetical protein
MRLDRAALAPAAGRTREKVSLSKPALSLSKGADG